MNGPGIREPATRTAAVLSAAVLALVSYTGMARASGDAETDTSSEPPSGTSPFDALGVGAETPDPALCESGPYTFGIDVFSDTQDYAVTWLEGLQHVADELGCVELFTLVDNADPATAISNLNTIVQRDVDGAILFQIIADAQPGVMDVLNEAGIPAVSHAVPAPGAPFISPSDAEAGVAGGTALGVAAVERFPDATPWLVLGVHPETGEVSENRLGGITEGVRSVYADLPDDHVIEIDSQSVADTAFNETLSVLARIPEGEPILLSGINDDVVLGMVRAVEQEGRDDVALAMGMGGLFPSGVEAVCRNSETYVGTVDFLPETAGQFLIPALIGMLHGVDAPDVLTMPVEVLDAEGLADKYPDFEPCQ